MRGTGGVCAFIGPEAKVMLDPAWPTRGVTNPKEWVDMPRLLECASGGGYAWNTATEARSFRARNAAAAASAIASSSSAASSTTFSAFFAFIAALAPFASIAAFASFAIAAIASFASFAAAGAQLPDRRTESALESDDMSDERRWRRCVRRSACSKVRVHVRRVGEG